MTRPYITYPYLATGGTVARTSPDRWADNLNVKDFGVAGDGVTDDTNAIQAAIDHVHAGGGGMVYLPSGEYKVSVSALTETYDNAGAPVPANTNALVLRPGVSLIGTGPGTCKITATDATRTVIGQLAPNGVLVQGFEIAGASTGATGAGHGIITLSTTGGADNTLRDSTWRDLYVHHVGSYGLGLQNGNPVNCRIENITTDTTGADGIDLKARGDPTIDPVGNHCSNITIRNHGCRLTDCAGIDTRGVWHLSNISVIDYGLNPAFFYRGIRFRQKHDPATDNWHPAGAKSSLTGFYIRPKAGAAATNGDIWGIESGSDFVHISNGVVEDCAWGVVFSAGTFGPASYNVVHAVSAINCIGFGFICRTDTVGMTFSNCMSIGTTVTSGFRDEGILTNLIGCRSVDDVVPLTTAGASGPSQLLIASHSLGVTVGEYGVSVEVGTAGRVGILTKGSSDDVDFLLTPKGAGLLRWGTLTATADAAVTGYITIKDQGGVTRKLAVIT